MSTTTIRETATNLKPKDIDELCERIKANDTAQFIVLRENGIGPKAAVLLSEAIEFNKSLTSCDLRGNSIGPHGAMCLSAGLSNGSSIKYLDLRNCAIGPDGAYHISMLFPLTKISLKNLNLASNSIADIGANHIASTLPKNRSIGLALDLRDNEITDSGIENLAVSMKSSQYIKNLELSSNDNLENRLIILIGSYIRRNIKLMNEKAVAHFISKLRRCSPEVETLKIKDCDLNSLQTFEFAKCLAKNISLTSLTLQNNALSTHGIQAIAKNVQNSKSLLALSIIDNHVQGDSMKSIGQLLSINRNLRSLTISNSVIINRCNGQKSFNFVNATLFHRVLSSSSNLTHIELSNCGICDISAAVIVPAIGWRSIIRKLILRNNDFGDYVSSCFARLVERSSSLHLLDISSNNFTVDGLIRIARAFCSHSEISVVNFGRIKTFGDSAPIFLDLIKNNSSIVKLSLSVIEGKYKWNGLLNSIQEHVTKNNEKSNVEKVNCWYTTNFFEKLIGKTRKLVAIRNEAVGYSNNVMCCGIETIAMMHEDLIQMKGSSALSYIARRVVSETMMAKVIWEALKRGTILLTDANLVKCTIPN